MRRIVVVGLVGGAVVVGAVVVARRRAALEPIGDGTPDWAPLRLVEPAPAAAPVASVAERPGPAAPDVAPWVDPDTDGECPATHPVKGNRSSRIYHLPGSRYYDVTRAERCFCDAEAAEADGYRPPKR